MDNKDISYEIERLLNFAYEKGMFEELDRVQLRNALMDLLNIKETYKSEIKMESLDSPVSILENILNHAYEKGIIERNTTSQRDLLDAKIMGILMPRQSSISNKFWNLAKNQDIKAATDYYYELSKASNYIRMDRIEKNLYWKSNTEYGNLEITINLSKPEKDPKDIALAKLEAKKSYPKCLLCLENVGYAGGINHPARQNHRVIPINLNNENWYMQYSPYVYYNEHSIVFKETHEAMTISKDTFKRLLDFTNQMPHYFIGSNADLPIVGGSILSHEHFQGGNHEFAMAKAQVELDFISPENKEINIGIVKWPMSVIRLSGHDKDSLVELSNKILSSWRKYSDEDVDILSSTGQTMHNTITPIARKNEKNQYELDLVLRNNRTNEKYPHGIFHPHSRLHHIKKENIGLIEVMGLAVLPGRLEDELEKIEDIILDSSLINDIKEKDQLYKHKEWIEELIEEHSSIKDKKEIRKILEKEVGLKFLDVLKDAGVYKRNEDGKKAFVKFMEYNNFEIKN
ncbi:MAG: UDP-glucose--hexose-1-phosphate uridylyltransferase [Senegalia sp. (in: firmicutes)]|uniref:UDP-glucose--hexose-1-phosphate uridylyltransferase n=1 Tax=Senegalia sp. (in: firmicutes) TaxID=1924098 RepID=UPI003F9E57DE